MNEVEFVKPGDQMNVERAKELMIRYGRCIVCGRFLKVAKSVERGIGPVCFSYFGNIKKEDIPLGWSIN